MLNQKVLSELTSVNDLNAVTHFGVVRDQTVAAPTINCIEVPEGQVFLIDTVVIQADTVAAGIAAAFPTSPDLSRYGITINDQSDTSQSSIQFQCFRRWQSTFWNTDSPNWRNAPPGNMMVWKPKYPIPVPEKWSVKGLIGGPGEWANQIAVYGRMVSMDGARTAGYSVRTSSVDADRRCGVTSMAPTTGQVTQIPAREGCSIRILDIKVQVQPETNTTNKVTLSQTDGRTICSFTNNNPSDMLDLAFSPDIFLAENVGLRIIGTVANTATIVVSWEYVDIGDVPGNHWWSYVEPDLPTPAVTKIGTQSNIASISTTATCFYPRRGNTKTDATQGFQHIIHGYSVSIQKDTQENPDQTACCISTGATGGSIKWGVLGTDQPNVQISPTFTSTAHDQCVFGAVDGLNIPCKRDDGAIFIDTMATGRAVALVSAAGTPAHTSANINNWAFTIWGRTVAHTFTNPVNRGV
jgi:hypothetical protein